MSEPTGLAPICPGDITIGGGVGVVDEDDEAVEEEDASRAPDSPSSPIAPLVSPIVSNTSNTSSFTSSTRAGIFFELPASSFADESPSRDGRRIPPNPRGISTAPLFDASSFDVFFPPSITSFSSASSIGTIFCLPVISSRCTRNARMV